LLVPTSDSIAISDAVLKLLTNRDHAVRMGLAAYERAVGLFGWDRFIFTLEQVYERVLDEHRVHRTTLSIRPSLLRPQSTRRAAA
jgi:glycosyltransferase involved in cell wall biosynthesis